MVLNRQGKRQSLSKNWELMSKSSAQAGSLTRPLSSLINIFNKPAGAKLHSSPLRIHPRIKELDEKQPNSPSQKSVKTFFQESKLLRKKALLLADTRPKTQVFPAFGPKSFSTTSDTHSAKKSDLSEAFSKLIISRQAKAPIATPNDAKEIIPSRLVNLKPVESIRGKFCGSRNVAAVASLLTVEAKKELFDERSLVAKAEELTGSSADTIRDYDEVDDSEGYREYSASFLSCSSIWPRSSVRRGCGRACGRESVSLVADINDLIGSGRLSEGEETDLDLDQTVDSAGLSLAPGELFESSVDEEDVGLNEGYLRSLGFTFLLFSEGAFLF